MHEIDYYDIESIYLFKQLHDSGICDGLLKMYQDAEISGDYFYEMAYEAIGYIFTNSSHYFNEEDEIETWVFMDPLLDEFCRLCQDYEQARGVSEKDNPFRQDFEKILYSGFSFTGYNYGFDWKLTPKERGKRRLLLYTGPEFYYEAEVPCGLLEIREGLESCLKRLKNELAVSAGQLEVLPMPAAEMKEAA